MRLSLLILLFTTFHSLGMQLKELDPDWSIYNETDINEYFYQLGVEDRLEYLDKVRLIKVALINGNTTSAHRYIDHLNTTSPFNKLNIIALRYRALTYFAQGNYLETFKILNKSEFEENRYFQDTCIVKIITALHVNAPDDYFQRTINRCGFLNFDLNKDSFLWLTLVKTHRIKNSNFTEYYEKLLKIISNFKDANQSRIWLKLGLLFDMYDIVSYNLHLLPELAYQDETMRSLMGFNLFKNGEYKKAHNFIEDINTTNAYILKTAKLIKNGETNAAFGQLKLGLKRRPYSINVNKFLVPTAWLTKNWDQARIALSKILPDEKFRREQLLLNTVLNIQEKNFQRAKFQIERLRYDYNKKLPFEGLLAEAYIKFKSKDSSWSTTAYDACNRFDGPSCWLYLQSLIWKDYSHYVETLSTGKKVKVLAKIKELTKKINPKEIQESVFIRQRDIEELDISETPILEEN